MDFRHRIAAVVLCLQLLLVFHTYRSTDFEVHRNWLAITHSLPISQWYYEATSEWTLDYPPLFAWFEWAMAKAAYLFDPSMLHVHNLNYASDATVLFQRLSVCATNLLLVAAMFKATRASSGSSSSTRGLVAFALVVCNAGLIMVDNIHFQYNGILMGLLVYSITCVEQQQYVLGGVLFAVLLNMKHLFAYLGPVYFAFLLRHYVLAGGSSTTGGTAGGQGTAGFSWFAALQRLLLLGSAVVAVCAVSFGPFIAMGQLKQVLSRLFPFARGLCHAYWAPNAWALYSFADKVAAAAAAGAGLMQRPAAANMAGGIVGISTYAVLPNVGAGTCALLVLLALVPCLVALWKARRDQALTMLAPAVAYANLCGFMFGYHVHEKAALAVEIPMALAAVRHAGWGQLYVLFSSAAHVGIFPLLFETQEVPIRWLLAVVYYIICVWGLASVHLQSRGKVSKAAGVLQEQPHEGMRTRRQSAQQQQGSTPAPAQKAAAASGAGAPAAPLSMHECCSWLPLLYRAYLAGLVVLELYCTLGHKALLGERLPFVPLMLTSVYCAVGVTWAWGWMAVWFLQQC